MYDEYEYEAARRKLNDALISIRKQARRTVSWWQEKGEARDEDLERLVAVLEQYDSVAADEATNLL